MVVEFSGETDVFFCVAVRHLVRPLTFNTSQLVNAAVQTVIIDSSFIEMNRVTCIDIVVLLSLLSFIIVTIITFYH